MVVGNCYLLLKGGQSLFKTQGSWTRAAEADTSSGADAHTDSFAEVEKRQYLRYCVRHDLRFQGSRETDQVERAGTFIAQDR